MSAFNYHFGASLPKNILDTVERMGLLQQPSPNAILSGFEKDAFYPNGMPKNGKAHVVYPAQIHHIIAIPYPEQLDAIPESYSTRAALAALKWLEKLIGTDHQLWTFNGLEFQHSVDGIPLTFGFPDTTVACPLSNGEPYAVLAFPDTSQHDDDWAKGWIPEYATAQAQLLLWCHKQYSILNPRFQPAMKAYLVRITGNLSVDNTVRTVCFDAGAATRIVRRIAKAAAAASVGHEGVKNLVVIPKLDWKQKKEQDLENAFRTEDPTLHDMLCNYMLARSQRKTIEKQIEGITDKMSTIAIRLADMLPDGVLQGILETTDRTLTVTHNEKRSRKATISADLLRQLCPEYENCIHESGSSGRRIYIDVL